MPRPSASGAIKKGSKAPNPLRETAFELFACGKTYKEISGLIGITEQSLARWREADGWNERLRQVQKLYQEKLSERLAGRRASADAEAVLKLIDVRDEILDALKVNVKHMEPGQLPGALRAVQDSLAKVIPAAKPEDDGPGETTGFDFVAEPADG